MSTFSKSAGWTGWIISSSASSSNSFCLLQWATRDFHQWFGGFWCFGQVLWRHFLSLLWLEIVSLVVFRTTNLFLFSEFHVGSIVTVCVACAQQRAITSSLELKIKFSYWMLWHFFFLYLIIFTFFVFWLQDVGGNECEVLHEQQGDRDQRGEQKGNLIFTVHF